MTTPPTPADLQKFWNAVPECRPEGLKLYESGDWWHEETDLWVSDTNALALAETAIMEWIGMDPRSGCFLWYPERATESGSHVVEWARGRKIADTISGTGPNRLAALMDLARKIKEGGQ